MPRPGGEADKLGNLYESIWTVGAVLDVFQGRFGVITVEPFGDESEGVEFHLETLDRRLQFHSLKRQKQGGDWSVADLCRENTSHGRTILGDLLLKRRRYPDAELRFVSATGANDLRELTERAQAPASLSQYRQALSGKLQTEFDDRIVPLCNGDEKFALAALKATEVILRSHNDLARSVERRIEELFYRVDGSDLRPEDVRRMLAEYVLDHLGPPITGDQIRHHIHEQGLGVRDWKLDRTVTKTVVRINSGYMSIIETELINATQIVRQQMDEVNLALSDPGSAGVLLVAPGGFGKSCVLAQCLARLLQSRVPTLCLRMDSLQPCTTTNQLGKQLDLPASPAVVLAGVADNSPSVLVVDQLDAMSVVSGRHTGMWEVFQALCQEVRSYPNMKLVLACRDFDLAHDHRLRTLGDTKARFTKVVLGKLTGPEVKDSLKAAGLRQPVLTQNQLEILGVPFHLLLFLQGDPSQSFTNVGQLYDRYWDRKQRNLRARLGRESHWAKVIDALTDKMSHDQALFAPKTVVDDWPGDTDAMVSEHVLVEVRDRKQIRFFHESFFDYAYARQFCKTGKGAVEFLCSTEQELFRRAQVRQILAFRREHDFDQYLRDVREILESPRVRFHIKRMVASGLYQIERPLPQEWAVVEPHVLEGDLSRYVAAALRRHVGWFDLLDREGVFERWLASNDDRLRDIAVGYLGAPDIQDVRSANIARLISPYKGFNGDWLTRIVSIIQRGKWHRSAETAALYLELLDRGAFDDMPGSSTSGRDFWGIHDEAARQSPPRFIDALLVWFDRAVQLFDDGTSWNFLKRCPQDNSQHGAMLVGEAAASQPAYFVEKLLPLVVKTVVNTEHHSGSCVKNRTWSLLSNAGVVYDVHDAILLHLRRSLQWMASHDPAALRRLVTGITCLPHTTIGYLLLQAWAENPPEFATECAEYLAADPTRLNIGYGMWMGGGTGTGESAISRLAIRAISPHCSPESFTGLEATIIGYTDDYEKRNPRMRGYAELLVLRSLDRTRISTRTVLRIEELERKFPDATDEIVREDMSSLARLVPSPIPHERAELMTDGQWVSAMQRYNGSSDPIHGDIQQLSQSLSEFAQRDRRRFATLTARMPDTVDPMYFSAVMDGICSRSTNVGSETREASQRNIDATPTQVFLGVIDRLHQLPGQPCGSAIVNCIKLLAPRELPNRLLEIVSFYATSDPDPRTDVWQQTAGGNYYYGGKPYEHGMNCVRGQAADAISALLFEDRARFERLRPALHALSTDPVVSVRTWAICAFLPLLNFTRDLAVELFHQACVNCEVICTTPPFARFIHHATHTHYAQIRRLLQFALNSEDADAVTCAATGITLAELEGVDVGGDAERVRSGTETQRQAAAGVYAQNLTQRAVGDACAARLEEFLDDESAAVRAEASAGFRGLTGDRLLELEGFITRYIESRSFKSGTENLLRALVDSNVALPRVICRAAERVLEFLGEEGTSIAYHGSMVAHSLSTLIVRQYEQTTCSATKTQCLDLIDRMERVGYIGLSDELSRIDR